MYVEICVGLLSSHRGRLCQLYIASQLQTHICLPCFVMIDYMCPLPGDLISSSPEKTLEGHGRAERAERGFLAYVFCFLWDSERSVWSGHSSMHRSWMPFAIYWRHLLACSFISANFFCNSIAASSNKLLDHHHDRMLLWFHSFTMSSSIKLHHHHCSGQHVATTPSTVKSEYLLQPSLRFWAPSLFIFPSTLGE